MKYCYVLLSIVFCLGVSLLRAGDEVRIGKDYALFIAIDDYRSWSKLRYPVKDVRRIARQLEERYSFNTEILVNPTRLEILNKLAEYREQTFLEDGQLLVFFSGHGEFSEATREGFFVPVDGRKIDRFQDSYIPLSRLKRAVNAIPCEHILLAIDACYSGSIDDRIAVRANNDPTRFSRPGSVEVMTQKEIDEVVIERLRTKSRLYFTSGGIEQTPDRSKFVDQFLTALGTTSRENPILDYNGLRYFLGKARPLPRTGIFDGNQPGVNDFLFVRSLGAQSADSHIINNDNMKESNETSNKDNALHAYTITVTGQKQRSNFRWADRRTASSVDRLKICIQFDRNPSKPIGSDTILIRVIKPGGKTHYLESMGSGLFTLAETGERYRYSIQKVINFDNSVGMHCAGLDWGKEYNFEPGEHFVEVYNKGYLAGRTSCILVESTSKE